MFEQTFKNIDDVLHKDAGCGSELDYFKTGVEELEEEKLYKLLELKYQSLEDAKNVLGEPTQIRSLFFDFQKYLYRQKVI